MFEILSTIGLTASASLVIAFLAHAMAERPRGRLTVAGVLTAWFALVVTIGASAALDPVRRFGVPALGLTVGLPVAAIVRAFFSF
jgi:TRAP-type C4-dicarboxylate transport system permease small subunit